jgi:N-hydroxyarylamine O-acetyltransferase
MLNDVQVARYLERLAYCDGMSATRTTLDALHQAHLLKVPFENYDVVFGTPIVLSIDAFYEKIVERKRGGFCYELNSLFGALLQTLGFKVRLFAAGVFKGEDYSNQFDHLLLGVEVDGATWIADVGFGDCFLFPLALNGRPSTQPGAAYRIETQGNWHILHGAKSGEESKPQYRFTTVPRALPDFAERCHYQQTAADSHFTQRSVCSLATETGRITLANGRHIVTAGGSRSERQIANEAECSMILKDDFGLALDPSYDISQLLAKA